MCPGDKENRNCANGEAYQASSYAMPCKSLENLKRDNQVLVHRGSIASVAVLCSGELTYAVVKVLKSSNRGI